MNNTAVSSATPGTHPMVLLAGRILIGAIFLNAGVRKLLGFAGTVLCWATQADASSGQATTGC